jgi:tRNA(Ile)-lysidine synthetase-like protein
VVAHFDHGIRAESAADAELVKKLAAQYQLEFRLGRGELGQNASEELARRKRYEFLRRVKSQTGADKVLVAHHQDDLIETILINLIRGTGWRGLAPMWSDDVVRPLLRFSKVELVAYAIKNKLTWAEDATNYSPKYLRNRVRDLAVRLIPKQRQKLLELHESQTKLRQEIENILEHKTPIYKDSPCKTSSHKDYEQTPQQNDNSYHYHFAVGGAVGLQGILELPEVVAIEVLRQATKGRLTTPQLKRLLKFLKTAKSGDIMQPGGKIQVGVYKGNISFSDLGQIDDLRPD